MSEKLNLDIDPAAGIKTTAEIVKEVAAVAPPPAVAAPAGVPVDGQGRVFDPAIHRVNPDGTPMIGSKRRLLLKPEAKRTIFQKAKDGFSRLWNGEENSEQAENPENPEIPLSDHEIPEIPPEKHEGMAPQAARSVEISSSAENSAELFFLGGSVALGIEFLNQRNRFHPEVARQIEIYERRTGKNIDLPPGVALAFGLGRIGWEIIQNEPACKQRFDAGAKVVRENAVKFIGRKFRRAPVENREEATQ
jgi:hypothetical protein